MNLTQQTEPQPSFLRPGAFANISGSSHYPQISGEAWFYETDYGTCVTVSVSGLPAPSGSCDQPIFALHIHSGSSCGGSGKEPFPNAGSHYNPENCPHPYHAGDLPPLFGNRGYALMSVLTDRFTPDEIIGKVLIIHAQPDDFHTQPSGNPGIMIACGEIKEPSES